jgi:6-phosphogluconolactonase (cycloisomerase 2 family)
MNFRRLGRIVLALAVSLGTSLWVTSCYTNYTAGYFFVTGNEYNQIGAYRIFGNLGDLVQTQNSPTGTGGMNPVQIAIGVSGQYLYVLNAGCGGSSQFVCPPNTPPAKTGANISLYTIGGEGGLSFQQTYYSSGNYPIAMVADSDGSHLFVLDAQAPDPTTCTGYVRTNPASACGDISAFNIDPLTGRLSVITNLQVRNSQGKDIPYFPVGSKPINFYLIPSGLYLYTLEGGSGTAADPHQAVFIYQQNNGQLTLTQNTPLPTGAIQMTYIFATSRYVYILDAENGANAGQIFPYTVSTGGGLLSLPGGAVPNTGTTANPDTMLVDHTGKFLYVANHGPNLTQTSPTGSVSAFFIDPVTGRLSPIASPVPFGAGASPRCILEDPSNQFLYTANYTDSTVTGAVIDIQAGTLTPLRELPQITTVGQPTWCAASAALF